MIGPLIILTLACAACLIGILAAIVHVQDRTIANQRQALDITTRTVGREHAAVEILQAELEHLSRSARVVTLWRCPVESFGEEQPWEARDQ